MYRSALPFNDGRVLKQSRTGLETGSFGIWETRNTYLDAVHVVQRLCSLGSTPVSSKMSSGVNPFRMSLGNSGASSNQFPALCRNRKKLIWSVSCCNSLWSKYSLGGRNGAKASPSFFSLPGFGGASYPPGKDPGFMPSPGLPPIGLEFLFPEFGFPYPASKPSMPGTISFDPEKPPGPLVGGMEASSDDARAGVTVRFCVVTRTFLLEARRLLFSAPAAGV